MLFRFTKSALENIKGISLTEKSAENRYSEWICDLAIIARKKYYFVSNAYSMVSVIFAAKGINSFEKFAEACVKEIKRICGENGFDEIFEQKILPNCENYFAGKTWNRSMTSKMNTEKMLFDDFYSDGKEISRIEKYINKDILKNLGGKKNEYGVPKKVFVSDFMNLPVEKPEISQAKNAKAKAPKICYQFYAELEDFDKKVWRRFVVDSSIKMSTLASTLITLFEARGGHLYEFYFDNRKKYSKEIDKVRFLEKFDPKQVNLLDAFFSISGIELEYAVSIPDEEFDSEMPDFFDRFSGLFKKNVFKTKMKDCFKEVGDEATFSYDFGDGWSFLVRLENIFQLAEEEADGQKIAKPPYVIEGKGYGIFENIGGTGALEELYKQFPKKKGELYEEICDRLEKPNCNLEDFDVKKMNNGLKTFVKMFDGIYKSGF